MEDQQIENMLKFIESSRDWAIENKDQFQDIVCQIPDIWKEHPYGIYFAEKQGEKIIRVPKEKHYKPTLNGWIPEEVPWLKDGVVYYGTLFVEDFKKVRDNRGNVIVQDSRTGRNRKFTTSKFALLELYNDLGVDIACFTGKCWRPISWNEDLNQTWFMDDPMVYKSAKDIYGDILE